MIEITDLTVKYGELVAVDKLCLEIAKGSSYGFIGPNGAGKTSTMRVLATVLPPTSGSMRVCGYDVMNDPNNVKRQIGYMPDFFGVYDQLTIVEYLDFFASVYGVERAAIPGRISYVLEKVQLEVKRDAYIDSLSRGMKQRLALARTIIHDPPVLILDEPASGLDPNARKELRALINELQDEGKTIFISSHILLELADICDHAAIIEAGKLIVSGPIEQILKNVREKRSILIRLSESPSSELIDDLRRLEEIDGVSIDDGSLVIEARDSDCAVAEIVSFLVGKGAGVIEVRNLESNLEEIFEQVTKGITR